MNMIRTVPFSRPALHSLKDALLYSQSLTHSQELTIMPIASLQSCSSGSGVSGSESSLRDKLAADV
jgi:hypothetical protein